MIAKRLLDIIFSVVLILLLFPVFLLIALAIKLDSPGPILYRRLPNGASVKRIGAGGRQFSYFKFRSMAHGNKGRAEDVTRVGNFIRLWHLDELPELFLVLSGKMSLVGPRPLDCCRKGKYPEDYYQAWTLKPGMTGAGQLKGKFISTAEKIETDLQYIKTWNIFQDFLILLRTPVVIFNQRHKPHF